MPTEVITNATTDYDKTRPIRFLSLDGGGMRGHYTAAVLDNLCRRFAATHVDGARFDLGKCFHGIVGVSTGSIIAAALAIGISPLEVIGFYRKWGPRIFTNPVPNFERLPALQRFAYLLMFIGNHARRAFNSDEQLRAGLNEVLGDATFGTALRSRGTALLIPTVDLSTHKVWVYKTSHITALPKHRDEETQLVDACLASSAAPYFFPLAYTDRPFVDGGLSANNPLLLALIEALEMTKDDRRRPIEVISVGTCPPPVGEHVRKSDRNWGFSQWQLVARFSATVLDAQVSMHVSTAKFLVPHLDRKATIFRLHQSPPSSDQAQKLGLDRADPEALSILELLGSLDAEAIHSETLGGGDRLKPIRDIFSNVSVN